MKAIIFFNNSTEQEVHGKDLRIARDAPGEYHITDAYHNHRLLAAYGNVQHISLVGKPKERKSKVVETLQVKIDTSELQNIIKEAMLELEALADKEQYIHKEDIDDDYLDKNIGVGALASYGVTAARAERDQLQKEVNELRAQIELMAFVPPDVATAAKLLDAELLVFLDQAKKYPGPDTNQDIHFSNGLRFAIGKLTGDPVPFAQVPFNKPPAPAPAPSMPGPAMPLAAPTLAGDEQANDARPATCTCPPKRNIIDRGHLSYCPAYEGIPEPEPTAGKEPRY